MKHSFLSRVVVINVLFVSCPSPIYRLQVAARPDLRGDLRAAARVHQLSQRSAGFGVKGLKGFRKVPCQT